MDDVDRIGFALSGTITNIKRTRERSDALLITIEQDDGEKVQFWATPHASSSGPQVGAEETNNKENQ